MTSQATPSPPKRFRRGLGVGLGAIEERDLGARPAQRPRRRQADRAGAAGHHRDLPGQRLGGVWRELGLFQRPVFDLEQLGFADRFEAADRLGIGDGLDPGFGDVGGDRRVLGAAPEPEQTQPRHQDHPRHRVELALAKSPGAALWRAK